MSAAKDPMIVNADLAKRLGWNPMWFGLADGCFSPALIASIKAYQAAHDIVEDGICDAATFRRIECDRVVDGLEPIIVPEPVAVSDNIMLDGELFPIEWDRVVTPGEDGALHLPVRRNQRKRFIDSKLPRLGMVHWDVTLNAKFTWRVLKARKLATHFVIDWDGTIYQMRDLAYDCPHSGVGSVNRKTWAIDFNNPVYLKHNSKLGNIGQPERPVINGEDGPTYKINGWKPKPFLGVHDVQLEAFRALLGGLNRHFNFPLEAHSSKELKTFKSSKGLEGWVHHAELRKGKWDTACVDLTEQIGLIK